MVQARTDLRLTAQLNKMTIKCRVIMPQKNRNVVSLRLNVDYLRKKTANSHLTESLLRKNLNLCYLTA